MRYLLDTDHLSVLQRQTGETYTNLSNRMSQYLLSDFGLSIVSFHEQFMGIHTYVNRAQKVDEIVKGYARMSGFLHDFRTFQVVPFDRSAYDTFSRLKSQRIQVATMDLRIAAIALCQNLILLTRNQRDFDKVPGLEIQDWTVSL